MQWHLSFTVYKCMFVLSLQSYPPVHLCHILVIPTEFLSETALPNLSNSFTDKKEKSEALNMLFWHLSDCRGVQGQEVELSSLFGMCRLHTGTCMRCSTLWLHSHSILSSSLLPDKNRFDNKVRAPIYSCSPDRSITTNYNTHKVALSHLQVIPNPSPSRSQASSFTHPCEVKQLSGMPRMPH